MACGTNLTGQVIHYPSEPIARIDGRSRLVGFRPHLGLRQSFALAIASGRKRRGRWRCGADFIFFDFFLATLCFARTVVG